MPEFILDTDTTFDALDPMVQGFIEVMFFTNQNTTGVVFNTATMESRWQTMDELLAAGEEPQPIKAHWDHPEIQEGLQEGTLDGCLPADCSTADLDPSAIATVKEICADWYAENKADADAAAAIYGMDRVGNDLAYTRGGHGVGFNDRMELPEDLRRRLDESAPTEELYAFWQEGRVYFEG